MSMNRRQTEKSLALWSERETRFRKNWKSKKSGDPRRFYWFQKLKYAIMMVDRRTDELDKLGVGSVSNVGLDLIKEFESFRSVRYQDPKGVWTIGYGETRGISRFTLPWTRAKAAQRLKLRVNRDYLAPVLKLAKEVGLHLKQNEADALASLVYNLGPGILDRGRSMGDAMRSKDRKRIADAILEYDEPNNPVVHAGLKRRRQAERKLFLK